MRPICSADEIRAAERAWFETHPGGDLFRPAVAALSEVARSMLADLPHGFVLVVAGSGNNGEDALRRQQAGQRDGGDQVEGEVVGQQAGAGHGGGRGVGAMAAIGPQARSKEK